MTESTGFPLMADWLPWLLLLLLAIAGGFINYYGRWRRQQPRVFSLFALVGELTTSGFVAILIALACQALEISRLWATILAGIGAHLGPRALFVIEWFGLRRIGFQPADVEQIVEPPTGFPPRLWMNAAKPKLESKSGPAGKTGESDGLL